MSAEKVNDQINHVVEHNAKLKEHDKLFIAKLYETFRNDLVPLLKGDDADDMFLWIDIITQMMLTVGKFKTTSLEKKEILMETIRIVIKSELPEDLQNKIMPVVNLAISPAIDMAIKFSKTGKKLKSWCCKH